MLMRSALIWAVVGLAAGLPVIIAATSPFLPSRNLAYIIAGFAGIVCLSLFLIQPLLAAGYLPGITRRGRRLWHRWIGGAICLAVGLHIGGLYVTSPPDTLDALLLVSPTPFSVYGVVATLGVVVTLVLVMLRSTMRVRYRAWCWIHNLTAFVVVVATVIHAVQIEGTMGPISKWAICLAALVTTGISILDLRILRRRRP